MSAPITLSRQLARRMKLLDEAERSGLGSYPGERWDLASKQFAQLERMGLVDTYIPHNPAHKMRAVLTYAGHAWIDAND